MTREDLIVNYFLHGLIGPEPSRLVQAAEFCVLSTEDQDTTLKLWAAAFLPTLEARAHESQAHADALTAKALEIDAAAKDLP